MNSGKQPSIRIGLIGGSGVEMHLAGRMDADGLETRELETPFGRPSAPITTGTWRATGNQAGTASTGVPIAMMSRHGPGHVHHPGRVNSRANLFALKQLGCTHIIATGATGSLREAIHPGELVLVDQFIDRTDGRPRTFFDDAAVHVEFADPVCPVMRRWLLAASERIEATRVHESGTYLCMEGPSFSTRAESHLYRQWGADLVGMTALPEARLAREAEMAYMMIALPTDYDCWRERTPGQSEASLLEEIIGNLEKASHAAIALIRTALEDVAALQETPSPAHDALKLAIWTAREQIAPEMVEQLRPLWGRHFSGRNMPAKA